jgi:ribosomal protein RSM22 (predicted rRNA methylase)
MGHYEDIKIDRSEGWKYSHTHGTNGDDYHARVYVDDKGNITEDSFSKAYKDKINEGKKSNKKKERKSSQTEKESCLMKVLKAPFRLLWWLTKKVLVILSLGMLDSWLNKK